MKKMYVALVWAALALVTAGGVRAEGVSTDAAAAPAPEAAPQVSPQATPSLDLLEDALFLSCGAPPQCSTNADCELRCGGPATCHIIGTCYRLCICELGT